MSELIITERSNMTAIADAIRNRTGIAEELTIDEMINGINSIVSSGGVDVSDATIISGSQMLEGVTAYSPNGKITGTIPSQNAKTVVPNDNSQVAIPSGTYASGDITVAAVPVETKSITSNGVYTPASGKYFSSVSVDIPSESFETQSKTITPTEEQQVVSPDEGYNGLSSVTVGAISADYVGSGVMRQSSKTITPTKSTQTAISANVYAEGDITVAAIPDEYVTTTDANAVANDIMLDKTAYVNGEKVTGSFTIDAEITAQEEKIAEQDTIISNLMTALEGKAAGGSTKTTKTVYLDWSGDAEMTCNIDYISNNKVVRVGYMEEEIIEAEYGIVWISNSSDSYIDGDYIVIGDVRVIKQDGETIYFVSSDSQ